MPMDRILPYEALYLNNKTADELFEYIKYKILEVSDNENIFKLSKLISLGFKKNTI
jgi:hypothetical protein